MWPETVVLLVRLLDLRGQPLREVGDAFAELVNRLLEALDVGFGEGIELVEQVGDGLCIGQVVTRRLRAVLEQDRALRVLENDVGERIAAFPLLDDFFVEVIGGVLCFPIAAREEVAVLKRAVGVDQLAADGRARARGRARALRPCPGTRPR